MKRVLCALSATILACGLWFGSAQSHAAYGDEFTRFDVRAVLDSDGVMKVTQTFDLKFAYSGHGPYVWFVTRQGYDDEYDRLITYSKIRVTSPTGAPTQTSTNRTKDAIEVRIGDPDQTVRGTHTYVLTYTVSGIFNPDAEASGMDELYWSVLGLGWTLPISNISVTIDSPDMISATQCYMGAGLDTPCTFHFSSGSQATFGQAHLDPGQGLDIVAGWPLGAFPGAKVKLVPKSAYSFGLDYGGWIFASVSAGLTALAGWGLALWRRRGRDEQYANVTPGEFPHPGDPVVIKREEVLDAPVAFLPPEGVPPRLVGAIVREGVADIDVTASILSLAVQGFIHFNQTSPDSFELVRTGGGEGYPSEMDILVLDGLFASGSTVTKAELSGASFYQTFTTTKNAINQEFLGQNWYKGNPGVAKAGSLLGGLGLAGLGGVLSLFAGSSLAMNGILGVGWVGVPFLVLGIGMVALARRMPVRTPLGSVVAIRSIGFKKYLETAEAHQIRWEEGQDIFSEYLPYAIAYGCADRWARIFDQLARQGAPVVMPTWYSGYGPSFGFSSFTSIGSSVGGIGSAFQQSQASATRGSSGGSGFSGGGGGGVGGGGGGSW